MNMLNSKLILKLLMLAVLCVPFASCEKPAGPGGKASVTGKVWANDWENTQQRVLSRGYSAGERVYIIYGNETEIGDDVRTGPDGSFSFKFLTKGHYKVFVNSLDTTIVGWKGLDTEKPVMQEFDITGANQKVTLQDFVINK